MRQQETLVVGDKPFSGDAYFIHPAKLATPIYRISLRLNSTNG